MASPAPPLPKGFGSFHSPSVEVLIAQPADQYTRPSLAGYALPPPSPAMDAASFGTAALKERLFLLEPEWTFINHGAFGAAFRPALEAARAFSDRLERQPLRFLGTALETLSLMPFPRAHINVPFRTHPQIASSCRCSSTRRAHSLHLSGARRTSSR